MRHCFLKTRALALTAGAVLATAAAAQAGFVLDLKLQGSAATASTVTANQTINLEVWGTVTGGTTFKGIQDAFFGVTNTGTANGDLSVVTLTSPFNGVATDATPNPTTSSGGTLYGTAGQKSVGSTNNAVADGWVFARSTSMTDVTGTAGTAKLGTLTYTVLGSPTAGNTVLAINPRGQTTPASNLIVPALYKEDGTTLDTAATAGQSITLTFAAAAGLPGDFDNDGLVGQNDLSRVLSHWNAATGNGKADGDWDGDGLVGQNDLSVVLANWNRTAAPEGIAAALTAVPEPATLGLMGLGLVGLAARRRRA